MAAVFNGEIYNCRELTSQLRGHGQHFTTARDTEVIVHLYEGLGADCIDSDEVTRLTNWFPLFKHAMKAAVTTPRVDVSCRIGQDWADKLECASVDSYGPGGVSPLCRARARSGRVVTGALSAQRWHGSASSDAIAPANGLYVAELWPRRLSGCGAGGHRGPVSTDTAAADVRAAGCGRRVFTPPLSALGRLSGS
jgi:glutamine phosphoribosylpyrophosphate amidotransferase